MMHHGTELAPRLSQDARKRELYGADTYYLESAEQLAAMGGDLEDFAARHAGVLLKPDAVATRQLVPAIDWLVDNGWRIVAARACRMDRAMLRALWQYQWNVATPYRRRIADEFLTSTDSLVLVVRRESGEPEDVPASVRLTEAKGPTDPDARVPGQLRYLLGRYCYLLNLVHTPDEPADVVRELGVHFATPERAEVYADALAGEDRQDTARALAQRLYAQTPERELAFEPAAKRLAVAVEALAAEGAAVGRGVLDDLPEAGTTEPATWRPLIERVWRDALPVDPWDVCTAASYAFPMRRAGVEPVLAGTSPAEWLRHLDPSAAGPQRHRPETSRPVPRELVHRRAIAEVFPTSVSRAADGTVQVGTQVPRRHPLFSDSLGDRADLDPLFFVEVCRQAMFVVAHTYHGVDLRQRFILRDMALTVADPALLAARPDPVAALVSCHETRRFRDRDGRTTGLNLDYRVGVDGRPALHVRMGMMWVAPERWAQVRGALSTATPPRVPPARIPGRLVDRRDPSNVVITPMLGAPADGVCTAGVVVDTGHPTFCDHEHDHLSGMLQVEAMRQLGVAALASRFGLAPDALALRGLAVRFRSFGELYEPAEVTAELPGDRADQAGDGPAAGVELAAAVRQGGRVLADGTLRFDHPRWARP
jgi:nucleoside diphosphate kinase